MFRIRVTAIILAWSLVMLSWLLVFNPTLSQTIQTPTPTPQGYPSLFITPDCAPPCWFGLIPGESMVEDVEAVFEEHPDTFYNPEASGEFDPDTGLLVNGTYTFYLVPWLREARPLNSRLEIREGHVDWIDAVMISDMTLGQLLQILGTPDNIQMGVLACNTPNLDFVYWNKFLGVSLALPEIFEQQSSYCLDRNVCQVSAIREEYIVDGFRYYSPEAAKAIVTLPKAPPQPALGYHAANDRDVPPEVWDKWLSGNVNMTCMDAWEQLPKTSPFDLSLTPSATKTSINGLAIAIN